MKFERIHLLITNLHTSTNLSAFHFSSGEVVDISNTESPRTHRMPVEMQKRLERNHNIISTKHHEAIEMDILNYVL